MISTRSLLGSVARNLAFLLFGVAIGMLLATTTPSKNLYNDLSIAEIKAGFSDNCDADIAFALHHSDGSIHRQAKAAIMRIPGVKAGSKSFASGKCYSFMRSW